MGKKVDLGDPKGMAKFMKSKNITASDKKDKFLKLFKKFSEGGKGSTIIDAGALEKIVQQCG